MISPTYNFRQFADAVKHKDYSDIILLAEQEATNAWRKTYSKNRNVDDTDLQSKAYQQKLLGLIDYLRHRIPPKFVDEQDFQLYHSVSKYAREQQKAY